MIKEVVTRLSVKSQSEMIDWGLITGLHPKKVMKRVCKLIFVLIISGVISEFAKQPLWPLFYFWRFQQESNSWVVEIREGVLNHDLSRNLELQAIICAVNTWWMQIIMLRVVNLIDMDFLIIKQSKTYAGVKTSTHCRLWNKFARNCIYCWRDFISLGLDVWRRSWNYPVFPSRPYF